jgi:hypothetical protein
MTCQFQICELMEEVLATRRYGPGRSQLQSSFCSLPRGIRIHQMAIFADGHSAAAAATVREARKQDLAMQRQCSHVLLQPCCTT